MNPWGRWDEFSYSMLGVVSGAVCGMIVGATLGMSIIKIFGL